MRAILSFAGKPAPIHFDPRRSAPCARYSHSRTSPLLHTMIGSLELAGKLANHLLRSRRCETPQAAWQSMGNRKTCDGGADSVNQLISGHSDKYFFYALLLQRLRPILYLQYYKQSGKHPDESCTGRARITFWPQVVWAP